MVKRVFLVLSLLSLGCGDNLVDNHYGGRARLSGVVLDRFSEGRLVIAWFDPMFQFEGITELTTDDRYYPALREDQYPFLLFAAPSEHVHEFPQLMPRGRFAVGVYAWVRSSDQPLSVVNNVVQGGLLMRLYEDPVIYFEGGSAPVTLSPDTFYEPRFAPWHLTCPSTAENVRPARDVVPFAFGEIDAGVPLSTFIPLSCTGP